jgi:DNA modification methylase
MPKDIESLIKSRGTRQDIIDKYGEVPKSIWNIDYSIGKEVIEYETRKQNIKAVEKHKNMDYDKRLYKAFSASSQNVRGKEGGLSTFPPDLAKRIVLFYSEKGDKILDPFAGHNSRMQVTNMCERHYTGYDVSKEFMEFNKQVENTIKSELFYNGYDITLKEKSSEKLDELDNSIDLCYTSPPYYNIEWYGDEPEQLGKAKTYDDFLVLIKNCIAENYRILKPNKYCVYNINDFRSGGIFYPYHADITKIFQLVGFKLWDIIIINWKTAIGASFASQIEDRKITAKSHEYLIVGKK